MLGATALLGLANCHSGSGGQTSDAGVDGGQTGDAGAGNDGGVIRGPLTVEVDGDPSSLFWDAARNQLLIADNKNSQIWRWTDAEGLKRFVVAPDTTGAVDAGKANVGQLAAISDGTIVVMRFGFQSYSEIPFINPYDGGAGVVPGTSPTRRRLALGVTEKDELFGSYFVSATDGGQSGAVTRVSLTAGESDYATGFGKIIGVLPMGGKLYVSDQQAGKIFTIPLLHDGGSVDDSTYQLFAELPVPDQLASGPNGSLFTGQFQAGVDAGSSFSVRQVFPDGGVQIFQTNLTKPSGLAYDNVNHRLFVADSNGISVRTIKIFPVD